MRLSNEPLDQSARILIIEDQEIVSEGLRLLLDQQSGFRVVGIASNCKVAIAIAKQEQPDLALLDINLGDDHGLNCLEELLSISPKTKVLVLTGEHDSDIHYSAISKGAVGIVRKNESYDKLIQAVRNVRAGEVWISGKLMARVLADLRMAQSELKSVRREDSPSPSNNGHLPSTSPPVFTTSPQRDEYEVAKLSRLTEREKEVIQLIGLGLRNQQIADRLFISVITVRHHLSSIFNKLDVGDRFELAIYAYRHGLAKPPI
jgi:two-component system, NarL family, response regulator DegU